MADYEIGYRKPPKNRRFKAGVSGNPKGRPKRKPAPLAQIIQDALDTPIACRVEGVERIVTPRELTLKSIVDRAVAGNQAAADLALQILESARRHGDAAAHQILIQGWLPDYPGQTAEQKTRDAMAKRDAEPSAWWRKPMD